MNKEKNNDSHSDSAANSKLHSFVKILRVVLYIGIGLLAGFFLRTFIAEVVVIDGDSMYPTLVNGDKHILNKVGKIDRYDVVVFHRTKDEDYIKRIIGLPSDTVSMKDDQLSINGKKVKEEYLTKSGFIDALEDVYGQLRFTDDFDVSTATQGEHKTIPEGQYLVLGDNRLRSSDSRMIGLVKESQIVGKLFFYDEKIKEKRSKEELKKYAEKEFQ